MMVEMRDGGTRTRHLLAGFALVHLVIFAGLFQSALYPLNNSGIGLYFADMNKLFAGQVPYRDFVLEYPPFAILFFAIPRLFGTAYATYYAGFQVEIILCDLAILATLCAIAKSRSGVTREAPHVILAAYTIFVLAVGPIIAQQFDLFAAAMVLGAVYCAIRGGRARVWIFLALGAMTKLYPALLAPIFVARDVRRRDWKAVAIALGVSIGTCLIVMLPLLVVAPTAIKTFFAYHAERGIQLESSYAALLLVADKLHIVIVGIGNSFGSWNVTGEYANIVARVSTGVLLAVLVVAYAFLYWTLRDGADASTPRDDAAQTPWATAALVVIFTTLVASKVLSPQYMMWALPLVPLVEGARRRRIWILFAVTCVMTYYIFPTRYPHLIRDDAFDVLIVLVARNTLLVVLALECARALRDSMRSPAVPELAQRKRPPRRVG